MSDMPRKRPETALKTYNQRVNAAMKDAYDYYPSWKFARPETKVTFSMKRAARRQMLKLLAGLPFRDSRRAL
jgi:hypothetical protein